MLLLRCAGIPPLGTVALGGCARARLTTTNSELEATLELRHKRHALFYDGKCAGCLQTLVDWLCLYEVVRPDPAASARCHVAPPLLKLGETGKGKAALLHVCRVYAGVPGSHSAAKWCRWAREELDRLGE